MYDGHHIQVVNWFTGEKLCVNRQLQDENLGLAVRAKLKVNKKVVTIYSSYQLLILKREEIKNKRGDCGYSSF